MAENHQSISHIVENRDRYKLMVGCEGCGIETEISATRSLRVCAECHNDLVDAVKAANAAESSPAVVR
jgi:transcription elongation factor Elf1